MHITVEPAVIDQAHAIDGEPGRMRGWSARRNQRVRDLLLPAPRRANRGVVSGSRRVGMPHAGRVAVLALVLTVGSSAAGTAATAYAAGAPVPTAGAEMSRAGGNPRTAAAAVPIAGHPRAVRVTPDQKFAYIAAASGNVVSIVDLRTSTLVTNLPVGGTPLDLAFNASGTSAYVANATSGTISVIDTGRRSVTRTLPVGGTPSGVAVSTSPRIGARLFVTDFGNSTVALVDAVTGATTRVWSIDEPAGVAATANGKVVVPSSADGTVLVIDAATLSTTTVHRPDQSPTNPGSIAVLKNVVVLPGDVTTWFDAARNTFSADLAAIPPYVTSGSALVRGGAYTLLTTRDYADADPPSPGVLSLVRNSDRTTVRTMQVGVGVDGVAVSAHGILVIQGPVANGSFELLIVPKSFLATP